MFCKIRKKHILLISTLVVVVVVGFVSFNNLKQNIKKTSSINVLFKLFNKLKFI
ncbi:hypothetical protein [Clostridium sp.]|jgi:hypothetical protein|uniref:hypothetical protein n=1 Tax=Clostridium sp. TaxID=1506 RepID=UPI002FDD9B9F